MTGEIAEVTHVPQGYLARILRDLSRAGLLTARRGVGGGFALAKPAGTISVWDVLEAAESGIGRIETCPLGIGEHGASLCALHQLLDDAIASVERSFKGTSIQDILMSPRKSKPLCQTLGTTGISIKGKRPE